MQAENPKLRVFGWARRFATSPPCITKEDVAMQMAVQVEFPHSTAVAVCSEGHVLCWRIEDGKEVPVDKVYIETRGHQSKGIVTRADSVDPFQAMSLALDSATLCAPATGHSKRRGQQIARAVKASSRIGESRKRTEAAFVDALAALWMCYLLACVFTLYVCVLLALCVLPAGFAEASEDSEEGRRGRTATGSP